MGRGHSVECNLELERRYRVWDGRVATVHDGAQDRDDVGFDAGRSRVGSAAY